MNPGPAKISGIVPDSRIRIVGDLNRSGQEYQRDSFRFLIRIPPEKNTSIPFSYRDFAR